jgi:mycobactin lysine-N-oxygenase
LNKEGIVVQKKIQIAVIGGGPKAVAIAAKATVLKSIYQPDVNVTIFERREVGSHWNGNFGYTTGEADLCTHAERDLGFPYKSMFGKQCAEELYHQFSWSTFAIEEGFYAEWVDKGRRPPSHKKFAEYLKWAANRAVDRGNVKIVTMNVTNLSHDGKTWKVKGTYKGTKNYSYKFRFDGVVVTGPGESLATVPLRKVYRKSQRVSARVFNGVNFWSKLEEVQDLLEKMSRKYRRSGDDMPLFERQVVILGGGGTGAATLAWFAQHAPPFVKLAIVANQATIHGRHDNPFENRVFSDVEQWSRISRENQRKFYDRLTRGIVWNNVIDQIKLADIDPLDGYAKSLTHYGKYVRVAYERDKLMYAIDGAIVIDATGFNRWWFTRLLPQVVADLRQAQKPLDITNRETQKSLEDRIDDSLNFGADDWPCPPLQVPNLASAPGPGFGSLMTLGVLSDHVIGYYLDPETP